MSADALQPGTNTRIVYDLISDAADGLTADQVDELTGWGHQSSSAAVAHLKRWGMVRQARDQHGPRRRITRNGRTAAVMVPVE